MLEILVIAGLGLILMAFGYCFFRIARKIDGLSRQLTKHKNETDRKDLDYYKQVESLFSIFYTLRPHLPFPDSRKWAASPDFLKKIIEIIIEVRPQNIVEVSSGVSTLVAAYSLKKIGKGKILSLEHDPIHVSANKRLLSTHGLQDVAEIVYAPLKKISIGEGVWLWYDLDCLDFEGDIDLLVIDGPPGNIQKMVRYPALPLLFGRLSEKGVILMDDGNREDEQEIVKLWKKEFGQLKYEYIATEKGAYLIRQESDSSIQP
ncbi:class I SAM-dependent methyltransferase [Thermodesulfobacteriota bacterium]